MRLGPIATLTALWELLLLAAHTGFRLHGPYLNWRRETAFGSDASQQPARGERWHALLDYGRWVHRMKRLR